MSKWTVKWPKKFKIPLDPVQPESTLRVNPSTSLPSPGKIWILPTLFLLQSLSTIWVQSHHNYPLPSLCPSNSHITNMPQRNALGRSVCVCQSRKVDRRGKQSLPTKIPCILQTEVGVEMRRWPRLGQYRGERVNPPMSYRGLNRRRI